MLLQIDPGALAGGALTGFVMFAGSILGMLAELLIMGFPLILGGFIVVIFYFWMKHRETQKSIYSAMEMSYLNDIDSAGLTRNPLQKKLVIAADGITPAAVVGKITGFRPDRFQSKFASDKFLAEHGLDEIYTFVVSRGIRFLWKKIAVKVFKRDIEGGLVGNVGIRCGGLKRKGTYYYPGTYGNYTPLYIESIDHDVSEEAITKMLDRLGDYSDKNVRTREPFIWDVERSKTRLDVPLIGGGKKKDTNEAG